jgi:hypothetical protein
MAQTAHDDVLEVGADEHEPPIIGADRGGLILVLNFLLLLMRTMLINSDHPVAGVRASLGLKSCRSRARPARIVRRFEHSDSAVSHPTRLIGSHEGRHGGDLRKRHEPSRGWVLLASNSKISARDLF